MLFSIKNIEELEKLNELVSLQNQVQDVRLQDKLGKQKFHEHMNKVFEPVSKSLENTSQNLTKAITESSIKNNKALEKLNNKLLKIIIGRRILANYLMSPLSKNTNPENSTQFKLVKDSTSIRVNDLLIHNSIPITLHDNLLSLRHTGKIFELKGDLLEMITNKNYNVDLVKLSEKKLMYEFAKEMNFDLKATSKKYTRDKKLIKNTQIARFSGFCFRFFKNNISIISS